MKIEAEIGQGRNGGHFYLIDGTIGLEGERYVCVGVHRSIFPAGDEGIVLPVFHLAGQIGRMCEAHDQFAGLFGDRYVTVPGIAITAGIG
jgi:hypothetical protein